MQGLRGGACAPAGHEVANRLPRAERSEASERSSEGEMPGGGRSSKHDGLPTVFAGSPSPTGKGGSLQRADRHLGRGAVHADERVLAVENLIDRLNNWTVKVAHMKLNIKVKFVIK